MEDFAAAASAYRHGLELDTNNANLKAGLEQAEARMSTNVSAPDEATPNSSSGGGLPDLGSLASMFGGGGGGEGMPNLAGMMNNPAVRQMAQNMMANGGMERLMQNPAIANMVKLFIL